MYTATYRRVDHRDLPEDLLPSTFSNLGVRIDFSNRGGSNEQPVLSCISYWPTLDRYTQTSHGTQYSYQTFSWSSVGKQPANVSDRWKSSRCDFSGDLLTLVAGS